MCREKCCGCPENMENIMCGCDCHKEYKGEYTCYHVGKYDKGEARFMFENIEGIENFWTYADAVQAKDEMIEDGARAEDLIILKETLQVVRDEC